MDKQYLRVKREKKTIFIECYASDKVEKIKYTLQDLFNTEPNDMRLYIGGRVI